MLAYDLQDTRTLLFALLVIIIPIPAQALCVFNCPPPEFDAVKKYVKSFEKDKNVYLCAPISFSFTQLSQQGFSSGSRMSKIARNIQYAKAATELGYLKKTQNGWNVIYIPTQKLTSLPKKPGSERCYLVEPRGRSENFEFVSSKKINMLGQEARIVLFKYHKIDGPIMLAGKKRIHPGIENGTRKGRCIGGYDEFKKTWVFDIKRCDFTSINAQFPKF